MPRHSNYYYNHNQDYKSPGDDVAYFLKKYEAQASLSSHKMYYVRQPVDYRSLYDLRDTMATIDTKSEPYVEMYIPQQRFKDLVENEQHIKDLEYEYRRMKEVVDMYRQDEHVRDSNPVVQKAWEKYLTLLELVRK